MTDVAILEVNSDIHGHPVVHGERLHYVVTSSVPAPAVAQMRAGGLLPNNDCAPAASRCVLTLVRGLVIAVIQLEQEEGTSTLGTARGRIVATLRAHGVPCHEVFGTPGTGWVMNPAWGGVIPPDQCQIYLDASVGWYCAVDVAAPAASPPTQGDDDMLFLFIPEGTDSVCLSTGWMYWHLGTPQEVEDDEYVSQMVRGGKILQLDGKIADLRVAGRPRDPEAAFAANDSRAPLFAA